MTGRKIAFPRYAEYNCAFKYLAEHGLGAAYILQPVLTRRTEELGSRYSPDFVCTPFKTCLGSMIEALESGADTLVMSHGLCRLGYYGELMEQILRDLGYSFDFINLAQYSGSKSGWLRALKRINPKVNPAKLALAYQDALRMVEHLDEVTAEYYENCGFETGQGGGYRRAYGRFLTAMYTADSKAEIEAGYRQVKEDFRQIPAEKPKYPLRVGMIGEFYTAMDAFSNLEAEQKLADMGVEVHRWMNLTHQFLKRNAFKNLRVAISDLCTYEMGPTSTANIWYARECARQRFDGLVHIKSANCTAEIDVMPVLQSISADYKIPTLYLTYDSQTSDVGLMTRLEAFYDMICARKKAIP